MWLAVWRHMTVIDVSAPPPCQRRWRLVSVGVIAAACEGSPGRWSRAVGGAYPGAVHHPGQIPEIVINLIIMYKITWSSKTVSYMQKFKDLLYTYMIFFELFLHVTWVEWGPDTENKRPKGPHIVHLSTMCHLCWQIGQCGHLGFPIVPKNTNLVKDVEIWLPVKFYWILFSVFSSWKCLRQSEARAAGSIRLPVLYKHITCIHTSKFNVQYGTVILFLYFPYPNYEKNPTSHLLLLWKGIFIFFLSRIIKFYTI